MSHIAWIEAPDGGFVLKVEDRVVAVLNLAVADAAPMPRTCSEVDETELSGNSGELPHPQAEGIPTMPQVDPAVLLTAPIKIRHAYVGLEAHQEPGAVGSNLSETVRQPFRFFSYCPDCLFDIHRTAEEAKQAAEDHLEHYRNEAGDGWSEDVTGVCWGEIKQETVETERRARTDDDMCDPEFAEIVDYGLMDVV